MSRKLASVRVISAVHPIEGADRIVQYQVDGWKVIGQKDQYKVGDLVIYLEIDSFVPHELAPFLTREGKEPKEFNGIKGENLKTIKLKGALSQGLLLPRQVALDKIGEIEEDQDVTELLGIQLWEPPVKLNKHGKPIENRQARKGGFPLDIPKSDQERIQNCTKHFERYKKYTWEITEKLDGSSMTVYAKENDQGVCSRNINLKGPGMEGQEGFEPNNFWKVALRDNLIEKIKSTGRYLAFQGELIGPGIQGNPYKLEDHFFYLYNIWDITNQVWLSPEERFELTLLHNIDILHVPLLATDYSFKDEETIDSLLLLAEGPSVLNNQVEREGLVFKSNNQRESFKVISNRYLFHYQQ
jgi:RNA ligase (TIGR02306 family)